MNRIQQKDKQSQSEHGMELWKYLPEFCLLRFQKNLKLQVQPAGKYYLVAAILINCRTCLYRSKRQHRQHLRHTCPIGKQAGLQILLFYFDYKMLRF